MSAARGKRARLVALGLAALALGLGASEEPVLVRRARRARALRAALEDLAREDSPEHRQALVSFEEPEAVLALVAAYARAPETARTYWGTTFVEPSAPLELVRAVELFALEPEPRDPRVREAVLRLALEGKDARRVWGHYLLAELESPRHAREPEGFAPAGAWVSEPAWAIPHAVAGLAGREVGLGSGVESANVPMVFEGTEPPPPSPPIEDSPWRALVRYAQEHDARVTLEGGRVLLVNEPKVHESGSNGARDDAPGESLLLELGNDYPRWTCTTELLLARTAALLRLFHDTVEVEPGKALESLARAEGLETRRVRERELVAFAGDRRALLAAIVARRHGGPPGPFALEDENPAVRGRALLAFDELEAFATILEHYASCSPAATPRGLVATVLEGAVLFAATGTPDARVNALVARLAEDDDRSRRFVGRLVAAELRQPSLPRTPQSLVHAPAVVVPPGATTDALAAISSQTGWTLIARDDPGTRSAIPFVAPPWRAILRLALRGDAWGTSWDVAVEGHTATLARRPRDVWTDAWEDPDRIAGLAASVRRELRIKTAFGPVHDKRRGLEVLAEMQGAELRVGPGNTLSCEAPGGR